jgi:type IV pilus secretin PilQ/predicted competence protein
MYPKQKNHIAYLPLYLIMSISLIHAHASYGRTFSYTPSTNSPFTSGNSAHQPLSTPAHNSAALVASEHTNAYNRHTLDTIQRANNNLIETHHLQILYANAYELATLLFSTNNEHIFTASLPRVSNLHLQKKLSADTDHALYTSLLSINGRAIVDERTNRIIVQDTLQNIEKIHKLIKAIDIPLAQVVIEANIVLTKESIAQDIGVQWSNTTSNNTFSLGSLGTLANNNLVTPGLRLDYGTSSTSEANILQLTLAALEKEGKVKIIAQPKITGATGQESVISSGTEIPYVVSTTGSINTLFKKALLSLAVIPRITGAKSIMLDIAITQDAVGTLYGNIPSIDTNSINTHILAKDGHTIVLGGLFMQTQSISTTKVPLLGDIPWIGWLFKSYTKRTDKAELLIFITPTILSL